MAGGDGRGRSEAGMTSLMEDRAECAALLKRSGSSFTLPIKLLPPEKRIGTTVLYAFCRRADDIVDDAGDPRHATAELDAFQARLGDALRGRAVADPVLRAVADMARRFAVPQEFLFDILDGVRMDLDHRGFETFRDLEEYCRRVASAVGLAAIHIWGFLSPAALEAAYSCGLAFQLTNILRDIVEDRDRGRVYLAGEDLAHYGLSRDDVVAGRCGAGAAEVARLYVRRADRLFREAATLDRLLTTEGRITFRAMFGAYHALFDAVQRADAEIFTRRATAPRVRLLAAMCAGVLLGPRP